MFRRPPTDLHWSDPDTVCFVRSSIADLRAAYGRYPGDRGIQELVTELLGTSPRFAEMWADHDVEERRHPRGVSTPRADDGPDVAPVSGRRPGGQASRNHRCCCRMSRRPLWIRRPR